MFQISVIYLFNISITIYCYIVQAIVWCAGYFVYQYIIHFFWLLFLSNRVLIFISIGIINSL